MLQWHTPAPPLPKEVPPIDFSRFKDTDIVYPLANSAELARLAEFIDELELADYVPVKSYNELKRQMDNPPIFATHVQLYVMTAKLSELRRDGLVGVRRAIAPFQSVIFPGGDGQSFTVANEPCSTVPQYFPQLAYGIESIITREWVRAYHRCCKLDKDHPGCWYGPEKYNTKYPWIIIAPNFRELATRPAIINGLRVPIVKGSYWLKDPTDEVARLRKSLENEIADAILLGKELSIEYFTLLELTYNEDFVVPREEPPPPPPPEDVPPMPINVPEGQLYLQLIAKIDEFVQIKDVIDAYDGNLVTPNMIAASDAIQGLLVNDPVDNAAATVIKETIESVEAGDFQILKESLTVPLSEEEQKYEKMAQVLNSLENVKKVQLYSHVKAAAARLGVNVPVEFNMENLEKEFNEYVNLKKNTIPLTVGSIGDYTDAQLYKMAREYFLTGNVPMPESIPTTLAPYGNVAAVAYPYSTGHQFKWDKDSCWYDSVITALFSIPRSPWEKEIRNATKMYVRPGCNANDFRNAIMADIEYLQKEPGQVAPSKAIGYFEKCVEKPQQLAKYEVAVDTFTNLKALFRLSNDVKLRETDEIDPNYTSFAAIVSRPGHFVCYILQPDSRWIRLDDIADPSERVLYVDTLENEEGLKSFKNKDIPGDVLEFVQTIIFYLDMRTDLWKEMIKLTPRDVFKHWQDVRNRWNLLQPVYLTEKQQLIKNSNSKGSKKIPSANKYFYVMIDLDSFKMVVASIRDGTFDYNSYPDGIGDYNFPEPADFAEHLNDLISVFNVLKFESGSNDENVYYTMLKLALKPRYMATVMYNEKKEPSRLVATDSVQTYVEKDEEEIMQILNYFFKKQLIKGKVMDV